MRIRVEAIVLAVAASGACVPMSHPSPVSSEATSDAALRARFAAAGEGTVMIVVRTPTPWVALRGLLPDAATWPASLAAVDDRRPWIVSLFDADPATIGLGTRAQALLERGPVGPRHRVLVPSRDPPTTARALEQLLLGGLGASKVEVAPPAVGGRPVFRTARGPSGPFTTGGPLFLVLFAEAAEVRIEITDDLRLLTAPVGAAKLIDTPALRAALDRASDSIDVYIRLHRLRDASDAVSMGKMAAALENIQRSQFLPIAAKGVAETAAGHLLLDPATADLDDLAISFPAYGAPTTVASLTPSGRQAWALAASGRRETRPYPLPLPRALASWPPRTLANLFDECGPFCDLGVALRSPFAALPLSPGAPSPAAAPGDGQTLDVDLGSLAQGLAHGPAIRGLAGSLTRWRGRLWLDGAAIAGVWSDTAASNAPPKATTPAPATRSAAVGATSQPGWISPGAASATAPAACLEDLLALFQQALDVAALTDRSQRSPVVDAFRAHAAPKRACTTPDLAAFREATAAVTVADLLATASAVDAGQDEAARAARRDACTLGHARSCRRLEDDKQLDSLPLPQIAGGCGASLADLLTLAVTENGASTTYAGDARELAVLAAPATTVGNVLAALARLPARASFLAGLVAGERRVGIEVGFPGALGAHDAQIWNPMWRGPPEQHHTWTVVLAAGTDRVRLLGDGAPAGPLTSTELTRIAAQQAHVDYVLRPEPSLAWLSVVRTLVALSGCGSDRGSPMLYIAPPPT